MRRCEREEERGRNEIERENEGGRRVRGEEREE